MMGRADEAGIHLVRQGGTDRINSLDDQLSLVMKWSHGGYLVVDQVAGSPPVFYSLDRDGIWTATAQFRNPDPTRFSMSAWDRQSDGTIVFSGQTETSPRVVSPFIAFTSPDGATQRMIRTDRYFPYEVAIAPDDSFWTLGFQMADFNDPNEPAASGAHVLRHFDRTGTLIGSAFPQSDFTFKERCALGHVLLAAAQDRVGWYGPQFGKAAYSEVALETMAISKFAGAPVDGAKGLMAVGLALTSGATASVSIQDGSPDARATYVLDRATAKWNHLSVPRLGGFKFTPNLIGSDANNLVFKYGSEAAFFKLVP